MMNPFLNRIRSVEKSVSLNHKIINTAGILLLGSFLGALSKFLDTTPANKLPFLLEFLDVRNFLGRFAFWVLIALCISLYGNSPGRASVNVFVFFAGMVTSYYGYSKFIAGFFPRSYAMIWAGFTLISPILAFFCWYAKGKGKWALALAAMLLAVLFNMSFSYGIHYFNVRSILELITFLCGVAVLRRHTVKDTVIMLGMGICIAFVLDWVVPFHFG